NGLLEYGSSLHTPASMAREILEILRRALDRPHAQNSPALFRREGGEGFTWRKKEEGRRKKEEGRRKKEEGRRKKIGSFGAHFSSAFFLLPSSSRQNPPPLREDPL